MTSNSVKEKWDSQPIQVKKSIQWKIHNISETHHLNTWTSLGLSIEMATSQETRAPSPAAVQLIRGNSKLTSAFSFSKEQNEELTRPSTEFGAKTLKWNLTLIAAEDGSDLLARLILISPIDCTLTYKVTVKIGRPGQLPLCPSMSPPREIRSSSSGQTWRILPLEQLCSPTNGLISEDALELFIDLVCYGSRAEGERGQVQYHPPQWNQGQSLESGTNVTMFD